MAWKDFIEVQIESVPLRIVERGQKLSARENALARQYHSSTELMFFIEPGQRHSNPERCIKDDFTLTCTAGFCTEVKQLHSLQAIDAGLFFIKKYVKMWIYSNVSIYLGKLMQWDCQSA